ncbi:MAG: hypothetical protein ACRCWQ_08580 [Bacilli bacterium]
MENELQEVYERMYGLYQQIAKLEQQITLLNERPYAQQITIENVNIENLKTEQFTFRLDTIDVGTLSGQLQVGNNFSSEIAEALFKENVRNETVSKTREGDSKENQWEEKSKEAEKVQTEQQKARKPNESSSTERPLRKNVKRPAGTTFTFGLERRDGNE